MGITWRMVMAAAIAVLAFGVAPADAQPSSEDVQACASQPDMEGFEGSDRTCTYVDAEGRTHSVSVEGTDGTIQPTTFGAAWFLFAVVWWIVPIFAGPYIAQRRGESVVIALALTIGLGWIGLAIVLAFQRRRAPLPASGA